MYYLSTNLRAEHFLYFLLRVHGNLIALGKQRENPTFPLKKIAYT